MAIQITLTEVEHRYEQIRDRATTPQQKENLHNIHSILKSMISNNIKPTMSGLIKHLNSKGPSIKASTIYNARDKGNLYRELYDAWELHWYTKKKIPLKVTPNGDPTFPDIVNHDDLSSITDDVLKYRITLLLNEYKNLKNQNNLLRNKIVSAPIKQTLVDPVNKILTKTGNYLDKVDIEVISRFLDINFHTRFNESGELTVKNNVRKDSVISSPGLETALKKLMGSV